MGQNNPEGHVHARRKTIVEVLPSKPQALSWQDKWETRHNSNIATKESPLAIYVHTPFCPTKCGYCDFNSFALSGDIMVRTSSATVEQIRMSPWAGRPAKTIFVGGGTPTYLPIECLVSILDAVREVHPPVDGCEITSEANPGTVDADKFAAMRQAGFNRISLGAQSFLDDDLVRLGRVHRSGEIERAVRLAREAGFSNLNLDLMFALPGQAPFGWKKNLQRAFDLAPDHLSLYCLTLEPNTPFYTQHQKGLLRLPDEDAQVEMYEVAGTEAARNGFDLYEISNFARAGRESRHNLCYWRAEEYAGYGPGAVGFVDGTRYTNWKHPEGYSEKVEARQRVTVDEEPIDEATRRVEAIMLGIRLQEGIDPVRLGICHEGLEKVTERGWVEPAHSLPASPRRIRLTPAGRHFCTEVALELIG